MPGATTDSSARGALETRPSGAAYVKKRESSALGQLPLVSLVVATGLLLVSAADQVSHRAIADGQPLFWAGLALIAAPVMLRQISTRPARAERVLLVLVLGVALYLVKVVSHPYAFTFPDEFAQSFNVDEVLRTQHLFQANRLLDITALYPGLPSVADAVASVTGASVFQAGIAVAGVGRALLMLGIFLLLEQVSGSPRLAALGASLYTANPNYLLYSADFGYETLALPLAVFVVFAAARRATIRAGSARSAWTIAAVAALLAVAVTHHVTSYALTGVLVGAAILALVLRRRGIMRVESPWDLAAISAGAVLAWLLSVANPTLLYLGQVLVPAAQQIGGVLVGASSGRRLFESGSGLGSPAWQQVLAFGSVGLIAAGLLYGLLRIRRHPQQAPFGWLLVIGAAAYVPIQALRLVPAAWETANRSSEFLFLGASLVLAVAATEAARSRWRRRVVPLCGVVLVLGGVVASTMYALQVPPPYLAMAANGKEVEPEGMTDARWAQTVLGPDHIVATDPSNAQAMVLYGRQYGYAGPAHGIQGMLLAREVDSSVRDILSGAHVDYVLLDRRTRSQDHSVGVYTDGGVGPLAAPSANLDPTVLGKFDNLPEVSRILDSGNVVMYDVHGLANDAAH